MAWGRRGDLTVVGLLPLRFPKVVCVQFGF